MIGERIKTIRKSKEVNLNQLEFGKQIGITPTAISKIEKGVSNPSEQTIKAICRVYRVNEEWLRDGEGDDEAMFELYDDKELAALFNEYKMDNDSCDIITAYVKMDKEKREAIGGAIKDFAKAVLDDNIQSVRDSLLRTVSLHHTNTLGLDRDINDAFNNNGFAPIKKHDPPLQIEDSKPDTLDKFFEEFAEETTPLHERDYTDAKYMHSVVDAQEAEDKKHGKGGVGA